MRGPQVARHERCYRSGQQILDLEHYLDVLEQKPGAFAGCVPLQQWREHGRWSESFDRLWESLQQRYGKQHGTKEMIGLLLLGREHGYAQLAQAISSALELGCTDAAAVRYLLTAAHLDHRQVERVALAQLLQYERSLPVVRDYDRLPGMEVM